MGVKVVRRGSFSVVGTTLGPKVKRALLRAALRCEAKTKETVRHDTGYLQGSVQAIAPGESDPEGESGEYVSVVYIGAEYGIYQEFGTERMSANPALTNAAREAGAALGTELTAALAESATEAGR
jgi:HK97 gp10 family phage protein